jgi:adhesin transport system membrane fusion protein
MEPTENKSISAKLISEQEKKEAPKVEAKVPPKPLLINEDLDFVSDSKAALLAKSTPLLTISMYSFGIFIAIFLLWASFFKIDESVTCMGKVVPYSQVQVIQNLEGGIVSKIFVKEGDIVQKNQILAQLDDTYFDSQYDEGYAKYLAEEATMARLQAEIHNQDKINFPEEVQKDPALTRREIDLFISRRKSLDENLSNLRASYKYAMEEIKITEPLVDQKVVSRIELLRLYRDAAEIKIKIDSYANEFREKDFDELTKTRENIAVLQADLTGLKDKKVRTSIYSPVYGIVKQIYLTTIGGVLKPGMPIMDIVPLNDKLIIEARVLPGDIGFIKVGQKGTVKITAYDYSIYGSLDGTVTHVSADTSTDEKGISYYEVDLETTKNYLGSKVGNFQIIPGMTASVDILTGKRTLMHYLLKPILRAKEKALRER